MGLRILLVSDHYPPFIGGAHRQTQLLAHGLSARGNEVSVATCWQSGLPHEHDDSGVTIYRLKELRTFIPRMTDAGQQRHAPPYPDPFTVWKLRRLLVRLKPDIVHSHGWLSHSCAAALLGTNIPLLLSARDYGYSCATRTLLYRGTVCKGPTLRKCIECAAEFYGRPRGWIAAVSVLLGRRRLRRRLQGVHSVSRFVQLVVERDLLAQRDVSGTTSRGKVRTQVITSFLHNQHGAVPDEAQLKCLPREPFILFVGGLQARKGLETLLDSYKNLAPQLPLVLIGYGPVAAYILPAGVTVLRDAAHETVMEAWRRAYFGVVPSVWPDPSPGVVREAMICGKAVIGTNIGGTSELIDDGVTGLLVPPGDATALTQAMQRLINEPQLCASLGQAAQERVTTFMASEALPQFEKLYHQLLEEVQGRA